MATGFVLWIVTPLVVIGTVSYRGSAARLDAPVTAWVPLVPKSGASSSSAGLNLTWSPEVSVPAPGWTGLVEAVSVAPGDRLSSNKKVAVIGGITRIAYHSDRPFGRSLSESDTGRDVRQLQSLLSSRNLPAEKSGTYGPRTADGVTRLARSLGVRGSVKAFDPSWVLFLSEPRLTIAKVGLTVGTQAPSVGEAVVVGSGLLRRGELITSTSLVSAQTTLDAASDDEAASADLSDVVEALDAPAGSSVAVGDEVIELAADRRSVTRAGRQALTGVVSPGARLAQVRLERPVAPDEVDVPVAAVFAGADGSTCVLVRRQDGGSQEPVAVEVSDSSVTTATVRGQLGAGDEVGLSPDPGQRRCG